MSYIFNLGWNPWKDAILVRITCCYTEKEHEIFKGILMKDMHHNYNVSNTVLNDFFLLLWFIGGVLPFITLSDDRINSRLCHVARRLKICRKPIDILFNYLLFLSKSYRILINVNQFIYTRMCIIPSIFKFYGLDRHSISMWIFIHLECDATWWRIAT